MTTSIGRGKSLKTRKLEAPRPKRQSSVPQSAVTSSESQTLLERVYTTVEGISVYSERDAVQCVEEVERSRQLLDDCKPDELEVVVASVRRRLCDPDLGPLTHVSLLQLLEILCSGGGALPAATQQYYRGKGAEMEQRQKHFTPRVPPDSHSTPSAPRTRNPGYSRQNTAPGALGGDVQSLDTDSPVPNEMIITDFVLRLRRKRYSQGCYQFDLSVQASDLDLRRVLNPQKVAQIKRATDTNITIDVQECHDKHSISIIGPSEATVQSALKQVEELTCTSTLTTKSVSCVSSPRSPDADSDLCPSPLSPSLDSPTSPSPLKPSRFTGRGRGAHRDSADKLKDTGPVSELNPQAKSYMARVLAHDNMFNSSDETGIQLSDLACRRSRTSSCGSTASSQVTEDSVTKVTEDTKGSGMMTGSMMTGSGGEKGRRRSSGKAYRDFDVVKEEGKEDYLQAWGQQITSTKNKSLSRQSSKESNLKPSETISNTEASKLSGGGDKKASEATQATPGGSRENRKTVDQAVDSKDCGDSGTNNGLREWIEVKGKKVKLEGPAEVVTEIIALLTIHYSKDTSTLQDPSLPRHRTPPGFMKPGDAPRDVQTSSTRSSPDSVCEANSEKCVTDKQQVTIGTAGTGHRLGSGEIEPRDKVTVGDGNSRVNGEMGARERCGGEGTSGRQSGEQRAGQQEGGQGGLSVTDSQSVRHTGRVTQADKSITTDRGHSVKGIKSESVKNLTKSVNGVIQEAGSQANERRENEMVVVTEQKSIKSEKQGLENKNKYDSREKTSPYRFCKSESKSSKQSMKTKDAQHQTDGKESEDSATGSEGELWDEDDDKLLMKELEQEMMQTQRQKHGGEGTGAHKSPVLDEIEDCVVLKPFTMEVTNKYQGLEPNISPPRDHLTTSTPLQSHKHAAKSKSPPDNNNKASTKIGAASSKPIKIKQEVVEEMVSSGSKSYSDTGSLELAPLSKAQIKRHKKKAAAKAHQASVGGSTSSDIDLEGLVRRKLEESYASLGTTTSLDAGTLGESDGTARRSSEDTYSDSDCDSDHSEMYYMRHLQLTTLPPHNVLREPVSPLTPTNVIMSYEKVATDGTVNPKFLGGCCRRILFHKEKMKGGIDYVKNLSPISFNFKSAKYLEGRIRELILNLDKSRQGKPVLSFTGDLPRWTYNTEPPMRKSLELDSLLRGSDDIIYRDGYVAYGRAFLLACAKSPHSKREPPQWQYFSQVVPEICCKNAGGFFDPDLYQTPSRDSVRVSRTADVYKWFGNLPQPHGSG